MVSAAATLFVNNCLRVCACCSLFGSTMVVMTAMIFPRMLQRRFMQLITTVSACDMFGSAISVIGVVPADSALCATQAAIRIFFYRSSWLWTALLATQLYSTVMHGGFWLSFSKGHLLVWSISIALVFLPLTTNTYGQDDELSGVSWCSIKGSSDQNSEEHVDAGLWLLFISSLPLTLAVLLCAVLTVVMYFHFRGKDLTAFPQIERALNSMRLYPIALLITWGPATIWGPIVNFGAVQFNEQVFEYVAASEGLGSLYGLFVAVVFFAKSKEARARWYQLLTNDSSKERQDSSNRIPNDFDADVMLQFNLPAMIFGTSFFTDEMASVSNLSMVSSTMHNQTTMSECSFNASISARSDAINRERLEDM